MPDVDSLSVELAEFGASLGTAPDEATLQRRYVDGISEYVPAFGAGMYLLGGDAHDVLEVSGFGVSNFFLARYEEDGRVHDPVFRKIVSTHDAAFSSDCMSAAAWTESALYEEVLHLHRMGLTAQAPILQNGQIVGTLNFGRKVGCDDFSPFERGLIHALGRVVSLALSCIRARSNETRAAERLRAALDLVGQAVVVTDLSSAERLHNPAAATVLAKLAAAGSNLDEVTAQSGDDRAGVLLHEFPLEIDGEQPTTLQSRTSRPADHVEVTFLELVPNDLRRASGSDAQPLTPRELEVARLAAWGLTDAEIADRLYLSPHTVKGYLKACYRKLGVNSRVALARRSDL